MASTLAAHGVFFFNDTATTEIYTLSLHDALPISARPARAAAAPQRRVRAESGPLDRRRADFWSLCDLNPARRRRSEEHTSELQSRQYLVCRLLLEKKNTSAGPTKSPLSWCT